MSAPEECPPVYVINKGGEKSLRTGSILAIGTCHRYRPSTERTSTPVNESGLHGGDGDALTQGHTAPLERMPGFGREIVRRGSCTSGGGAVAWCPVRPSAIPTATFMQT